MERFITKGHIITASTYLLDSFGKYYGLERKWQECDEEFRRRILNALVKEEEMSRDKIVNKTADPPVSATPPKIPEGYRWSEYAPYNYLAYIEAGWSNEQLITSGFLTKEATQTNEIFNQQEEINMTQARKVYNFKLIDSDPALPVDQALVHDFGDVVVEDDIETVKQQLLGDNDLKAILAKHNKKRVENVNLTIQQNTGNTVKLLPLTKVKELTWSVK